jgi:hypothetical protein
VSVEALVAALYSPPPRGARNVGAADVLRVWLTMAEASDPGGANSCLSLRVIAASLNLPKRTVENAIDALRAQGLIVKTADAVARARGTTYTIACSSPDELARGIPGRTDRDSSGGSPGPFDDELVRGIPGRTDRDSSGRLVRGTRPGIPRREPEPDTGEFEFFTGSSGREAGAAADAAPADLFDATASDDDPLTITSPRLRRVADEARRRAAGLNVRPLRAVEGEPEVVDESFADLARRGALG